MREKILSVGIAVGVVGLILIILILGIRRVTFDSVFMEIAAANGYDKDYASATVSQARVLLMEECLCSVVSELGLNPDEILKLARQDHWLWKINPFEFQKNMKETLREYIVGLLSKKWGL